LAFIKQYDVSTLENLAIELNKKLSPAHHFSDSNLWTLLNERRIRLDSHFEWTVENQKQLLVVNDMFLNAWEKAINEAKTIMYSLENRISNNDDYLMDYEIEVELTPYTWPDNDDKKETKEAYETFEDLLSEKQHGSWFLSESLSHTHFNTDKDRVSFYLDRSCNWNLEYFNHVFDLHYIGLSIHELLDAGVWCFSDILQIKNIWSNINVIHQSDLYLKNYRGGNKNGKH
jgi:hypothetical protein